MAVRVIGHKKRLRQDEAVQCPAVLWYGLEGGLNLLLGFSEERVCVRVPRCLRFVSSETRSSKAEGSRFVQKHCVSLPHFMALFPSNVRIATRYGLVGSGVRNPVVARFSTPVYTGPETHPASCENGYWVFLERKFAGDVALIVHPNLAPM
jgi:hypothetical protein